MESFFDSNITPNYFATILLASFIGFLISTVAGIGAGMVLAPTLMQILRVAESIAISAAVMLVNNLFKGVLLGATSTGAAALLVGSIAGPPCGRTARTLAAVRGVCSASRKPPKPKG